MRLIVLDYLALCSTSEKHERHDLKIGAMCVAFKALAQETSTAVVVLEQLSRAADRERRKPRMSDLRDSGLLEAHADVVIVLHPTKREGTVCDTELLIVKQRQGSTGSAMVSYHRPTMTYLAKAAETEPDAPPETTPVKQDSTLWTKT